MAKKPAASSKKKPAKTQEKPQATTPAVDTAVAAAAAARLLLNRDKLKAAESAGGSAAFAEMKASLSRPPAAVVGDLLKDHPDHKRPSSLPQDWRKQIGHKQTSGGDAGRRNVPRRTNG